MAGGNFSLTAKKIRPGTYINFEHTEQSTYTAGARGTALLPLIKSDFGPAKEFIDIYAQSPSAVYNKFGYSIYDDDPNGNMLLIREALKNASKVIVFIPTEGTKATVTVQTGDESAVELTATAQYGGSKGNQLKVSVVANVEHEENFDVIIRLGDSIVERVNDIKTVGALKAAKPGWVDFTGDDATELKACEGVTLTGGADGTADNAAFTEMLDKAETLQFNTIAFPYKFADNTALGNAVCTKVKYLRENVGKYVQAVVANHDADYEGVINVTNGVILEDGTQVTAEMACAYIAGITAAATYTQSNTYKPYIGAVEVLGAKAHDQAEQAIQKGEMFFTYDNSRNVVIEYDINTLHTIPKGKHISYSKNRVIRVLDTIGEVITASFPPGKFANSRTGWDVMEGMGRAILQVCQDEGAIEDFEPKTDFVVDPSLSQGDETYFNVAIKPIDSADKLFFTIKTR